MLEGPISNTDIGKRYDRNEEYHLLGYNSV
jgi:hypothetical protein